MMQQVTVTAETSVALKPLIESAVRSELRMLEMGLERTRQRLRDFETQYGLSSEEFARRYEGGELSESLDFIEWTGEVRTYELLLERQEALQGAHVS
jgi:hypothetical protein